MSQDRSDDAQPRARDLLPPAGPAPTDPRDVRPADDALLPPVDERRIGVRRVSALAFGDHVVRRLRWRPAGNSRSFWSKIEADDPFMAQPARPLDGPIEIYPTQRIPRTEGSLPKPQPDVARQYPPPSRQDPAPPPPRKPQATKAPPRQPSPAQRHTPEPRPAPTPPPPRAESPKPRPQPAQEATRPEPPAPTEGPAPLPPIKPPPVGARAERTRTGRTRIPSKVRTERVGPAKSAAEIREEKLRARRGEQPKNRSLDEYRDFMQKMDFLREKYEAGEELPEETGDVVDKSVRRPKPKASDEAAPTAPTQPPATPQPAPIDRRPPMPKRDEPKPVDRSPASGGSGGLDDLFGGGGDRVRIGRRSKPGAGGDPGDDAG